MVLITAAIAIIGDIVFRMGTAGARKWFAPREELRVKLLSTEAKIPTRGSEHAAGLDLYSIIETMLPPGDSVLVKTGIALELPPGSYGRIAPRSSLAIRRIETGAGVVDRDFGGEIKVLLRNHSDVDLRIYKGRQGCPDRRGKDHGAGREVCGGAERNHTRKSGIRILCA